MRKRLTYANVTATLALVVALSGGAYAATSLVRAGGVIRGCVDKQGRGLWIRTGRFGSSGAVVGQAQLGDGGCHTYLPFISQVELFETDGSGAGAVPSNKPFFILFN